MPDRRTAEPPVDRTHLLGREYWLIRSTPAATTTAGDIEAQLDAHLRWMLELETTGVLFLSGPLIAGPGVGPGSGITVLRVETEDEARRIAAADPLVQARLRTFDLVRWRLNEGDVTVRLSLGTGTYQWR